MKGKVYKQVVRVGMLYGLETVALRKQQEAEPETAQIKSFSIGTSDDDGRTCTHVRMCTCEGKSMLAVLGQNQTEMVWTCMDVWGWTVNISVEGCCGWKWSKGGPQRRFIDVGKQDIKSVIGEEWCRWCGEVEADDRLCWQLNGEGDLEFPTGTNGSAAWYFAHILQ